MTNRPKNIGTAAETAVVRYLTPNGFPHAERRALRGTKDYGDITGTPGIAWEVKGGDAARNASDGQIALWVAEAELERANSGADLGVLVVARHQRNVRHWWVVLYADVFAFLVNSSTDAATVTQQLRVRLTLAEFVTLLRHAGYGTPINQDQEGTPA